MTREVGFKITQNIGRTFENMVFVELMRNGFDIYQWKSKNSKEVDFIVRKGAGLVCGIQVCLYMGNRQTREREIQGLIRAYEELGVKKLFILTEDEEGDEKIGKASIKIIPIYKWCFNPVSIPLQ